MTKDLAWMSQPFAHRGLHDPDKGIIENTSSAVQAALDQGYGIEVDLQQAACGAIMVFHDATLERLTHSTGSFASKDLKQLQNIPFRGTNDKMLSLVELIELVEGKIPMLLEIKSNWHLDEAATNHFVSAILSTLKGYEGQYGVMSFDPSIVHAFRTLAPTIPRGLISEAFSDLKHWHQLSLRNRISLRFLLSFPRTRPDFIAYDINALPAVAPILARKLFMRPLLTWTVRSKEQKKRAQKYCDAMIFESFLPSREQSGAAQ